MNSMRPHNQQRNKLLAIVAVGAVLRLAFLGRLPNGFFTDEASTGYDAYSLLLTGKDQYGTWLPLFARSFGDYNEALYRYLAAGSIALFGLDEFAVRLPAALIGIATIVALYWLALELFEHRTIALYCALLIAISPWHVQFSRIAFRANLLPLFVVLATASLLRARRQPRYLLAASACFSLSLYSYAAARVFVPLFVLVLMLLFWRDFRTQKRLLGAAGLLFASVLLVLGRFWISPEGMARATTALDPLGMQTIRNYFSYFDPSFLFWRGDVRLRHGSPIIGQLHPFEFVTVLSGIYYTLQGRRKRDRLLLAWLFIYPLPAFLTAYGSALRAIIGSVVLPLLSGFGLYQLSQLAWPKKEIALRIGLIVIGLSVGWYLYALFLHYPQVSSGQWAYGRRAQIAYMLEASASELYVSDAVGLSHSHILFYAKIPPAAYQQAPLTSLTQDNLFYTNVDIGRFKIRSLDGWRWEQGTSALWLMERSEQGKLARYVACRVVDESYFNTPYERLFTGQSEAVLVECS